MRFLSSYTKRESCFKNQRIYKKSLYICFNFLYKLLIAAYCFVKIYTFRHYSIEPLILIFRHQHRCIKPSLQQPRLQQQATCEETWSGHRRTWRPKPRRKTEPGYSSRRAQLSGLAEWTRIIAVSSRSTLWTIVIRATEHHRVPNTSHQLTIISQYFVYFLSKRARGIVLSFSSNRIECSDFRCFRSYWDTQDVVHGCSEIREKRMMKNDFKKILKSPVKNFCRKSLSHDAAFSLVFGAQICAQLLCAITFSDCSPNAKKCRFHIKLRVLLDFSREKFPQSGFRTYTNLYIDWLQRLILGFFFQDNVN